MRGRTAAAAMAGLMVIGGLGGIAGPAPAGATGAPVPADEPRVDQSADYFAVAVDQSRRAYLSAGPGHRRLIQIRRDGTRGTLDNLPGAAGLALSGDNRTLYVALAGADAVAAVDTRTFRERTRYPVPAKSCPTHLARTGATIWISYGCGTAAGSIGRLDISTARARVVPVRQTGFTRAPLLAAGGSTVVAAPAGPGPVDLRVYRVQAGELAPGARGVRGGSGLADLAVSPDGRTLFIAAGSRDRVDGFRTADLRARGSWPTGAAPVAVAVSPNGEWLATGVRSARAEQPTYVLRRLGPVSVTVAFRLPAGGRLATRGFAWSANNRTLAVVSQWGAKATPSVTFIGVGDGDTNSDS